MSVSTEGVLRQALRPPLNERAALLDGIAASVNRPNAALDKLWLREAEHRLPAFRSGGIEAMDEEEVFNGAGGEA